MGKIIVGEDVTLDGVIESNEKWRFNYSSEDLAKYDMEKIPSASLLGRKTYDIFASFWPNQKHNEFGIADALNRMPKYVVSSTLNEANWNNTKIIKGNLLKEISELKKESKVDIGVAGSATLVQFLMQNGLVDELNLLVFPVVLGSGKRLFENINNIPLYLIETKKFSKGVILLRYRLVEQ